MRADVLCARANGSIAMNTGNQRLFHIEFEFESYNCPETSNSIFNFQLLCKARDTILSRSKYLHSDLVFDRQRQRIYNSI